MALYGTLPVVSSSLGVSIVAVISICSDKGSWVPQSAQKAADSGFSDMHLVQLIYIAVPLFFQFGSAKKYQGIGEGSKKINEYNA